MSYYDTFIKSSKSPKSYWHDGIQELVNQEFENASTYWEDLEEEDAVGTLVFHKLKARITSLIDAKTGQRINDDFKKIIFSNIDYHPPLGSRFRFDNNIWMVYSTENIRTDTASVYVRRCNNVMTTQDCYGNIHYEPIYIDYKVTENQLIKEYSINVPNGRIQFWCQLNEYTKNIKINDRYIFGREPYRVREVARYDRTHTFDKNSVKMISFYAELDALGEDDNLELGIANYKLYEYKIFPSITSITNVVDFEGNISCNTFLNEKKIEESIVWETTDPTIAVIDNNGNYKFLYVGNCKFICRIANKPSIYSVVNITVENKISPIYEYSISPADLIVKQNTSRIFVVTEYLNGIKTNNFFDFKAVGVSSKNYIINNINSNSFEIINLRPSKELLEIICTSNTINPETNLPLRTSFYIELGGIV